MDEYTLTEEERREFSRRFLASLMILVSHPSVRAEVAKVFDELRPEDLQ